MATVQDLRDQVKAHTIGTVNGSVIISDAQCDYFLGVALDRMLNDHDWKFQETASVVMEYSATADGLVLPADFIQESAVYQVDASAPPATSRSPLGKVEGGRAAWVARINEFNNSDMYPTPSVTGTYYYTFGDSIFLVPQPSGTTVFEVDYIRDLGVLTDTHPFVTKFPRVLLSGAIREAYLWLHEEERSNVHEANFMAQMGAAKKRDIGTRMSGQKKVSGP